jgi:hypothetical protein
MFILFSNQDQIIGGTTEETVRAILERLNEVCDIQLTAED